MIRTTMIVIILDIKGSLPLHIVKPIWWDKSQLIVRLAFRIVGGLTL